MLSFSEFETGVTKLSKSDGIYDNLFSLTVRTITMTFVLYIMSYEAALRTLPPGTQ